MSLPYTLVRKVFLGSVNLVSKAMGTPDEILWSLPIDATPYIYIYTNESTIYTCMQSSLLYS